MRIFYFFLLGCCLLYLPGYSQSNTDCINRLTIEETISIESKNYYLTRINFEVCYTQQKAIVVNLQWKYFRNGILQNEKRAARRGHQLILQKAFHSAGDIFNSSAHFISTEDNSQKLTVLFNPKENATWEARDANFTFQFLYKVNDDSEKDDIVFDFSVPAGSTGQPGEPKMVEVQENLADTVYIIDTVVTEVTPEEVMPAPVLDSRDNSTEEIEQESVVEKTDTSATGAEAKTDIPATIENCIDSIDYYYNQLADIYNQVVGSNSDQPVDRVTQQRYRVFQSKFRQFTETCNHSQTQTYKREGERFITYLNNYISMHSETAQTTVTNEREKGNNNEKQGKEVTIDLKDLYMYLLTILFVVLLVIYLYPKLKKKRK